MTNIVDTIALKVIEYYAQYPELMRGDILHTQEVVSYTRLIAAGEELTHEQIEMQECAAWLHDIGCPKSKEIYGNSLPENQERVGRDVAKEILERVYMTQESKEWLVDVVGSHHQAAKAEQLRFQPLFEADLIVNLLSGYHPRDKAPMLYSKLMKSESGRQLFQTLIKTENIQKL